MGPYPSRRVGFLARDARPIHYKGSPKTDGAKTEKRRYGFGVFVISKGGWVGGWGGKSSEPETNRAGAISWKTKPLPLCCFFSAMLESVVFPFFHVAILRIRGNPTE